ncbi:MAG TPA: twin-arginine translocase TatA/TatE family subunit [Acidobacteriaceae bacterium]|nr:twin-arginine translocase TatA/TatE family subunit [Acidobacteriaceae bacterium]
MSLPDTVFIFVLALIIFGPKKLPEIGRQIGRLVGEFRRASNEFKFQIEEELRQAERTETPPATANTIAPPVLTHAEDADLSISTGEDPKAGFSDSSFGENMPAGQHPNPDAMQEVVDSSAALEPEATWSDHAMLRGPEMPVSLANMTAAAGAEARRTVPYAPAEDGPVNSSDTNASTAAERQEPHLQNKNPGDASSGSKYPASSEAEIHHG